MQLFPKEKTSLADRYIINPFSVLRKTTGVWQDRKHMWLDTGITSEEGRDTKSYNALPRNIGGAKNYNTDNVESVSIFDPVLCEIMYKWFSKEGDKVLDPFAGGSVRGLIASKMGRNYTGIDLSQRQIIANRNQYKEYQNVYPDITGETKWIAGDSEYALDQIEDGAYQMLFTCPPYYNREQYTRDPRDLSRQETYEVFLMKYTSILNKAFSKLNPSEGAFAVIVVGEIRSPEGPYYGLVPDTINICRQAGLHYYNEIILEDSIGSLPVRGPKYFDQSRKIGKHHQNILVFYHGDMSKIREKCELLNATF